MRTTKGNLKGPRMTDVFQAIGEQDVIALRIQLKGTLKSMGKTTENERVRK